MPATKGAPATAAPAKASADPDSWRDAWPDLYGLLLQVGLAADTDEFDLGRIARAWVGGRSARAVLAGRIARQYVALCATLGAKAEAGIARLANRHLPRRADADALMAALIGHVAGR
ncbi:MAG: hypothetical protein IT557_17310 [Alphaproteobacteria bacterium]|nr:hypothetical protein [Alphaproteobacteria bacterium]